jgi:flagellar basal body-associated protein FliL
MNPIEIILIIAIVMGLVGLFAYATTVTEKDRRDAGIDTGYTNTRRCPRCGQSTR